MMQSIYLSLLLSGAYSMLRLKKLDNSSVMTIKEIVSHRSHTCEQ